MKDLRRPWFNNNIPFPFHSLIFIKIDRKFSSLIMHTDFSKSISKTATLHGTLKPRSIHVFLCIARNMHHIRFHFHKSTICVTLHSYLKMHPLFQFQKRFKNIFHWQGFPPFHLESGFSANKV